ncbi:MAG TPA: DNA-binding protein [Bacteroidales bacterium]|nr:DNA-binding protein [Bacteroidales bacterium]
MEEEAGIKEVINGSKEQIVQEEIYTKVVRAGKRTYFFDVKATRKEDHYLTITESKKRLGKEGKIYYEKHKIFLYKEDFDKFADGFKDAVDFICNGIDLSKKETILSEEETVRDHADLSSREFTNIDFEDLDNK